MFSIIKQLHTNLTGGCSYLVEINYVDNIVIDSFNRKFIYIETRKGFTLKSINYVQDEKK